jgi:hypothetical protein
MPHRIPSARGYRKYLSCDDGVTGVRGRLRDGWDLAVDNVDELWEGLKARARIVYPIETMEYGVREFGGSFGEREECGDRSTAPVEDIWCETIRGCSYSGGGASYSMSAISQ